jgi:hypothetical protein
MPLKRGGRVIVGNLDDPALDEGAAGQETVLEYEQVAEARRPTLPNMRSAS